MLTGHYRACLKGYPNYAFYILCAFSSSECAQKKKEENKKSK